MAEASRSGGPLAALVRLTLDARLIALLLTALALPFRRLDPLLIGAFGLALATSLVPLLAWERIAAAVMRHPAVLVADLVISVAFLAVAGTDSAFYFFGLATALLAGVLYRWPGAGVFSVLLVAGYYTAYGLRSTAAAVPEGFLALVGAPALYAIAAAAGAAVRGLLDQQLATRRELAERVLAAGAADERARLARELHDSLGKTLRGLALSAAALRERVDDPRLAEQVGELRHDVEEAAAEARRLLAGLRADELDRPLADVLAEVAAEWSERVDVPLELDLGELPGASPATRYEVFCVVREALSNVQRHAGASKARVRLSPAGPGLQLVVADDGCGFPVLDDLGELEEADCFGLVGMRERAARIGGQLSIDSTPGAGTTVRLEAPLAPPGSRLAAPTGTTSSEP